MHKNSYLKLALVQTLSFIAMYAVMFANVDDASHIVLSLSRAYVTVLMVMPMLVFMLLIMPAMYPNRRRNIALIAGAVVVFAGSFWALRTQTPIGDVQYMKAMIPHHSSAIMTSRHATLRDPETRELARQIIESQEREIVQMRALIRRLESEAPAR